MASIIFTDMYRGLAKTARDEGFDWKGGAMVTLTSTHPGMREAVTLSATLQQALAADFA
ncbi:hypothetical protein [Dyella choica]|uniref:hypothetical protein n=1 Tax=Dyella choica TaxID=1927959 RepID=UPI0013151094|nr:hypothetical protein [Dyella choica]